jgi:hypothetical protein
MVMMFAAPVNSRFRRNGCANRQTNANNATSVQTLCNNEMSAAPSSLLLEGIELSADTQCTPILRDTSGTVESQ